MSDHSYLVGNTLVDRPRLNKLTEFLEETKELKGDVVEVGVYRGGTARWICERTKKNVYLFDTFEGLPTVGPHDLHHTGDFSDTTKEYVKELLTKCENFEMYKGIFPKDTSFYIESHRFSLVHLDVDIYSSVKDCLEFFGPRMDIGGIIVLDDYNEVNCPGAKLAANEFALANGLIVEATVQSQAIIRF